MVGGFSMNRSDPRAGESATGSSCSKYSQIRQPRVDYCVSIFIKYGVETP
jgi:hypothetical protein